MVVALCEEGVDRNLHGLFLGRGFRLSPSAKRAWIEIRSVVMRCSIAAVALCEEGVDRNSCRSPSSSSGDRSPSAKRAWIEIRWS